MLIDGITTTYEGILERFQRQRIKTGSEASATTQKKIKPFLREVSCYDCHGKRYNSDVLSCKIMGYNIADMTAMQVDELLTVIQKIDAKETAPVREVLSERLRDLIQIGLDYVSLDRETSTLSGGESQRVKMVKHLLQQNILQVALLLSNNE